MVESAANMILDAVVARLTEVMIDALDEEDPTRISELRVGKLQDDPTANNGLNILVYASDEENQIHLYTHNLQNGLVSPTAEVGGGWTYMHPVKLRFTLHFQGENDRAVARNKAQVILARARWAIVGMHMPRHPDTNRNTDDFGETIIEVVIYKAYLNEGGGPGHFIHRGWMEIGFLTEQLARDFDTYYPLPNS